MTLSCNATGKPTPTITWTKVEDNGTDGAPLFPVVEGKHLLSNIQRSANGTYRCTADNGVGVPVNRTVSVKVECKSSFLYSYDYNFQISMTLYRYTSVNDRIVHNLYIYDHSLKAGLLIVRGRKTQNFAGFLGTNSRKNRPISR